MIIPEAMLLQIRVEVFSSSEHLLPSHKVPRCIGQVSAETIRDVLACSLPCTEGRGEGGFCILSDVTQRGLPNHVNNALQRKDSCKFLCGRVFRTVTKNSRGPFPQLSGSYVEVGLLAVKYGTTWIQQMLSPAQEVDDIVLGAGRRRGRE